MYYFHLDRLLFLTCRWISWKVRLHQRVGPLPPSISEYIFLTIRFTIKYTVTIFRSLFPARYTDADPYKNVYVDPASIVLISGKSPSKRRGWVCKGTWDLTEKEFMNRTYPAAIRQRFRDGSPWVETPLTEKYTGDELRARGSEIDDLYGEIQEHGYRSQSELLRESPEVAWRGLNDAMHPLVNEITVDIGRDGELLWNIGGQHRLAIAKVLDIDAVPVQVFRRHKEWQKIRERARRGEEVPERFREHPDLQDVFDEMRENCPQSEDP